MYKIVLMLGFVLFFVGCNDKSESSPLAYSPLKIAQVQYSNANPIINLAMHGNIYLASKRNKNVDVGYFDASGAYKNLAILSEASTSQTFFINIDTDGKHIVVGEPSPDAFYLYKIEDNATVSKGVKITAITESSSRTVAGNLEVDGDTIAVSELRDFYDEESYRVDEKVLIYKIFSDTNVSIIQEIKSEHPGASEGTDFGEALALDGDTLAIAEMCSINLYAKQANGTFEKSESFLVDGAYAEDRCYLNLELQGDYLLAYAQGMVYFYTLKNAKLESSQEIFYKSNASNVVRSMALMGDTLLLGTDAGLRHYSIEKNQSDVHVNHFIDTDIAPDYLAAGDKYFITSAHPADKLSIFDSYPLQKIFVYNDANAALTIDEGVVSNFYSIDANSPAGDLHYTLGGKDAAYFKLEGNSLSNLVPFDYENPFDANLDNNYSLFIEITDAEENHTSFALNVQVLNREYMLQSQVKASDSNTHLGKSLSLDENSLLVGANASAYLFDVDKTLTEVLKIVPEGNNTTESFGSSVAKSGNTLVISAPYEGEEDTQKGAAYLFTLDANNSVKHETKIQAPTIEDHARFGMNVAMHGNLSVIAAPGRLYAYRDAGKVYLYTNEADGSLTLTQTLESNEAHIMDAFGIAISLSEKYLVIGSEHSLDGRAFVGRVAIYKREANNRVSLFKVLEPNEKDYGQFFGSGVAVDGDYLVIGARGNNDVYVYKINATDVVLLRKIQKNDAEKFSASLAIKGRDIAVIHADKSLYHYVIQEDDSVALVEIIRNYDKTPKSEAVTLGSNILVGGSPLEGIVSLYKKE